MIQNLNNEKWLPVVGYEGLYEVSNFGRIKGLERINDSGVAVCKILERVLKLRLTEKGYLKVALYKNGVSKNFRVHRIVASSFIRVGKIREEINHKNGIKTDNKVENLEWCTHKENMSHAYKVLGYRPSNSPFKMGASHILYGKTPHNAMRVKCDTLGIEFDSFAVAERDLGLYKGAINQMFNNDNIHVNGLTFIKI